MATIKIAGVMRAGAYSPNHIGNDSAIFNFTVDELRKRGCEVNIYTEEQFIAGKVKENIILNMCREKRSVELLQQREQQGALVINSGFGIENCIRERMTRILLGSGIPYPKSLVVNTDEGILQQLQDAGFDRCWIKRGESYDMHKEDVSFVRHAQEAQEVLQEYFLRGIKRAVINVHLDGDSIKFYGVYGSPFFFWFYPFGAGRSKYGAEAENGSDGGIKFDEAALKKMCEEAADVLDVKIYGGNCIIGKDGSMRIIDFNDWPSFAPCREEAAPHIARFVLAEIKKYLS